MSDPRTRFYQDRDRRTKEFTGRTFDLDTVHVAAGVDVVSTAPGQALLLATVNQILRMIPRLSLGLSRGSTPLRVWSPFAGTDLRETIINTAAAIDPFAEVWFTDVVPAGIPALGLGCHAPMGLKWYVGASRAVATLGSEPQPLDTGTLGTLRGAALGSCLGTNALLRTLLGRDTPAVQLSTWNYAEGEAAELGPDALTAVDVGHVLLIGAGAVASNLVYWLKLFGVSGRWDIVDHDSVALHNTNRSLLFSSAHAGWQDQPSALKAEILAHYLPQARYYPTWYHECKEIQDVHYDLVLCLANDYDVRSSVAGRGVPVVLHATTGREWLSQLHRHVVGRDDCIRCRTQDLRHTAFSCSTAVVERSSPNADAALPFLSAASALMLATAMQRLHDGSLVATANNDWRWYFDSEHRMSSAGSRACGEGCNTALPPAVRRRLGVKLGRWASLDPANLPLMD